MSWRWRCPAIIAVLSALRLRGWAALYRPSGPLGSDPAIWGLTALDLRAGKPPLAVPLYPWLAGLAESPVSGGLTISLAAGWALPLAAWWAAGRGWAGAIAGGAALLLLDPLLYAFQLQPDACFALWAVLLSGALLRGRWSLAIPLAALGTVLREQGPPILVLVLLAALSSGPWRARLGRGAALLLLALGLPPLLGGVLGGPQPWSARTGASLALLTTDEKPPHLTRGQWERYRERAPLGRAAWHAERTLEIAWDGLIWIGLAGGLAVEASRRARGALAPRRQPGAAPQRVEVTPQGVEATPRRGRSLVLALLPALPSLATLVLWSERRHIAAVIPVAAVVIASWLAGEGPRRAGRPVTLAAVMIPAALLLYGASRAPEQGRRQREEGRAFPGVIAVAHRVCALARPGDLILSPDQRLLLWCHLPQLADPAAPEAWRTWLVAPPGSVRRPWTPVDRSSEAAWIWRVSPDLDPRPCQDTPADGRYLLASGPTPHPAFSDIPLPGRPPITLPSPDPEACP